MTKIGKVICKRKISISFLSSLKNSINARHNEQRSHFICSSTCSLVSTSSNFLSRRSSEKLHWSPSTPTSFFYQVKIQLVYWTLQSIIDQFTVQTTKFHRHSTRKFFSIDAEQINWVLTSFSNSLWKVKFNAFDRFIINDRRLATNFSSPSTKDFSSNFHWHRWIRSECAPMLPSRLFGFTRSNWKWNRSNKVALTIRWTMTKSNSTVFCSSIFSRRNFCPFEQRQKNGKVVNDATNESSTLYFRDDRHPSLQTKRRSDLEEIRSFSSDEINTMTWKRTNHWPDIKSSLNLSPLAWK